MSNIIKSAGLMNQAPTEDEPTLFTKQIGGLDKSNLHLYS